MFVGTGDPSCQNRRFRYLEIKVFDVSCSAGANGVGHVCVGVVSVLVQKARSLTPLPPVRSTDPIVLPPLVLHVLGVPEQRL